MIKYFLFCRDRTTQMEIGLYLILLAKSPTIEKERLRWNLGAFGMKDNLLHLTVGFAYHTWAFCKYIKVGNFLELKFPSYVLLTMHLGYLEVFTL